MSGAIQSLIFDLDGTLIDSKPAIFESFKHAAATVLADQLLSMANVTIGPPLPEMFRQQFPTASDAKIDQLVRTFREHYAARGVYLTQMFEGGGEVLALAKQRGIDLYIATNKPLRLSNLILDNLKITPLFRAVLTVDSKLPPFSGKVAMLGHLIDTCHLIPAKALYVGDTGEDAEAASTCGLPFVWASYGYGQLTAQQNEIARHTISRLKELAAILE